MDKFILKIVALFRGWFIKQGIDADRMLVIVETKLMMDKRRVHMNWRRNQQQKENKNQLGLIMLSYGLIGIVVAALIVQVPSMVLGMIIFHAYMLFMMAMTLITDFSTVLLDTADNQIILPKPVNSKTLFMARLVHILVYLLQFTMALAIAPLIAIFIKYSIVVGLVSIVTVLLTVLLAVFITYILYLLILRFSNEEKVKEVVTYFQIFMTVFFAVGYQVLPRLINLQQLGQTFELHWYSYLLPPVWMALALDMLYTGVFDTLHIVVTIAAIGIPVFLFWVLNKYLAPSFAARLALAGRDSSTQPAAGSIKKQSMNALSDKVAARVCRQGVESASFSNTWKITGRDKGFRLQFYPTFGYILVFIFIFVFNSGRQMAERWQQLPSGNAYLWLIYLPLFTVSSSIMLISINENYQASWVYYSAPVQKPGELISGAIKALFIKYFIPVFVIMFCIAFYIWGIRIIDDFIFGLVNSALCFIIMVLLRQHTLPFSQQPNIKQQSGRFIIIFVQFMIIGVLVGIHYLTIVYSWLMYALFLPIIVGCYFMIRELQRIPWKKIAV